MNLISVITPMYKPEPEHLLAAYESLRAQDMPNGWAWVWVVQEDGHDGVARHVLPDDAAIRYSSNRHLGVAHTRNLGLARAEGLLVKNLDQDDVLTPGVLARDIQVLDADPSLRWTTSRVLDLLEDGSTFGFDNDPPSGPLRPGFVFEHWQSHNYRLPVHPTTICIRRDLAAALGGWMAVPGSDDTGLLIAASIVSVGYFHAEVGLFYRKWPGQVTASPEHTDPLEWNLRMRLISDRAESLRKLWPLRGECEARL